MVTIAWDVDDVLNDLMREWFEAEWKAEHPKCNVAYEDLSENPPHHILEVSKEHYLESLDAFRADSCYNQMIPVHPVKEWFIHHGQKFRHVALTAVPFFAALLLLRFQLTYYHATFSSVQPPLSKLEKIAPSSTQGVIPQASQSCWKPSLMKL